MSYALELRADSQRRFRALPIDVQESLLDLLEELADTAAPTTLSINEPIEQHRLTYKDKTSLVQVHFSVKYDHLIRRLTVFNLWYVARI